jgi:hypothetical protein
MAYKQRPGYVNMGGVVLAYGWLEWTENEDSRENITLDGYTLLPQEKVQLLVRNGSPTVDVTCYYGPLAAEAEPVGTMDCTMNDTANTITCTAHGYKLGQKISFGSAVGGVSAGEELYYIVAVPDADTLQFSVDRGGAAFNITANVANTIFHSRHTYVQGSVTVGKYASGTSTVPMTGQETVVLEGLASPIRLQVVKSAATAAAFNVYVELRKA